MTLRRLSSISPALISFLVKAYDSFVMPSTLNNNVSHMIYI